MFGGRTVPSQQEGLNLGPRTGENGKSMAESRHTDLVFLRKNSRPHTRLLPLVARCPPGSTNEFLRQNSCSLILFNLCSSFLLCSGSPARLACLPLENDRYWRDAWSSSPARFVRACSHCP